MSRGVVAVSRGTAFIGFLTLFGIALATLLDVILRTAFLSPMVGMEDAIKLVSAMVVASFFPLCLLQGHNITIRFFGKALGGKAGALVETLGRIATLGFFGVLAWQAVLYALDQTVNARYTWTLKLPTAPFWWVVAAIMIICVLVQLYVVFAGLWPNDRAGEPEMHDGA